MNDDQKAPDTPKGLVNEGHTTIGERLVDVFEEIQEESGITGMSDYDIAEITDAIRDENIETVTELVTELSIQDTAELLQKVNDEERKSLFENYGDNFDPQIFSYLDSSLRKNLLSDMPAARVAAIVSDLDSDDALDILEDLEDDFQQEIIKKLSAKIRIAMEEGLTFPEESAGRLMQREYVAIPQFWTVGKTIDYLRAAADELPDEFFDLIVINPFYHVVGEIPLNRVLRSKRNEKIENLTLDSLHVIPAAMDQEEAAHIFRREGLLSAPVVDNDNRLIGVITIDDIIDVIDEEAQEDILKLAGVGEGDLYRAVLSTTNSRFRWLFVNLITAILASVVISFFDATIEQIVALAVLMPIVASMGGNAGTQALTVAVRALATKELSSTNTMRVIWKETLVGTLNGIAFAMIIGVIAALWFSSPMLGIVIGAAMVINLIFAGLFGAGIPILLNKFGSDPALSSTVLLTTVTDIVGFFGFLGLASLFLI
ncbi:MAG: magnesium transporter [Alphaproteobacteria bacterium]|nr:magnesium transporter [Alphaproteobacteria bacterium]NCQ88267.1 magnesium transporter [Alphaproteobacteria bacterium]NCT05226.1 magnesium transporter [Alphaproteobacteria bacterium]